MESSEGVLLNNVINSSFSDADNLEWIHPDNRNMHNASFRAALRMQPVHKGSQFSRKHHLHTADCLA